MNDGNVNVFDFVEVFRKAVRHHIVLIANVIHTMHDFQQHRAHVVDQREEHHLKRVGIVGYFLGVQFRNLTEILQNNGHRPPKLFLQLLDSHTLLIVNAMKESGDHGDIAQAHLHDGDACHVNQVVHVGLARKRISPVILFQTIPVSLVNQGQMLRRIDGGADVDQHGFVSLLDTEYFQ